MSPTFRRENFVVCSIEMKTCLHAFDLWEVTNDGLEPESRRPNAPVAQLRQYNEYIAKKSTALSIIHSLVNDTVFTRIMACTSAKET